jgi:hypothetical protein
MYDAGATLEARIPQSGVDAATPCPVRTSQNIRVLSSNLPGKTGVGSIYGWRGIFAL